MIILAIETSCDETAAAVVKDGRRVLSSVVSTQIQMHRPYAGVVPELASRAHVETVNGVIEKAMADAGRPRLDAVAVTTGPGLTGALLVGRMAAEALGWVWGVPVFGVNHIEGHLLSPVLIDDKLKPPFLGLVVSGGHTELIYARAWGDYQLVGRTRDDAAGEAFDKVAKMLGLGYPGGPAIDRLAKSGDASAVPLPQAWLPGTWDFSFSGLKTAVLYLLREKKRRSRRDTMNVCAGFQKAVVSVVVGKAVAAARALGVKRLVVGGGVAANSSLRSELVRYSAAAGVRTLIAPPNLCTDNAAMIGTSAYFKFGLKRKGRAGNDLRIRPQLHFPPLQKKIPAFALSMVPLDLRPSHRMKQLAK